MQGPLDEVRSIVAGLWTDALRLVDLENMPSPKAGGKLLRPALCLLSAGALGAKDLRKYAGLAAAFEALHVASLAHDDVIDRAFLRRGDTSLNALWDNHAAVLGGDYLVARAVEMLAEYGSCPVIANAIGSVRRMAEGELFFFGKNDSDVTEEDCIKLSEQKTASLFAEACSAPAFLLDPARREPLRCFGNQLGIAFQIVDDLLDVTQPASGLGKPSCGDVAEGKQTLPIMFLREVLDPEDVQRLGGLRDAELSDEDRSWIMKEVRQRGVHDRTLAMARRYADAASASLNELPEGECREAMRGLLDFILVRVS